MKSRTIFMLVVPLTSRIIAEIAYGLLLPQLTKSAQSDKRFYRDTCTGYCSFLAELLLFWTNRDGRIWLPGLGVLPRPYSPPRPLLARPAPSPLRRSSNRGEGVAASVQIRQKRQWNNLIGMGGFEPPISCSQSKRLSH